MLSDTSTRMRSWCMGCRSAMSRKMFRKELYLFHKAWMLWLFVKCDTLIHLLRQDYARFLGVARSYFLDTVDELLADIVQSEEDLEKMMRDPVSTAWKNPKYEERLRKRLDRNYEMYVDMLRRIPAALTIMCEKLGIDDFGKVSNFLAWNHERGSSATL